MLSFRLVKAIESHAEQLTRGVVHDLQTNQRTPTYHTAPAEELHHRAHAIYSNLGRWLGEKTDQTIEAFYAELGKQRSAEGIPLCEVVYALLLTKYHLRDYIRTSGLVDSAVCIRNRNCNAWWAISLIRRFTTRSRATSAKQRPGGPMRRPRGHVERLELAWRGACSRTEEKGSA